VPETGQFIKERSLFGLMVLEAKKSSITWMHFVLLHNTMEGSGKRMGVHGEVRKGA
jgi:hypothetical protein